MKKQEIKVGGKYLSLNGKIGIEVIAINKRNGTVKCRYINRKQTWEDRQGNIKIIEKQDFTTNINSFIKDFKHGD